MFLLNRHRDCLEDPDEATGSCSLKLFPEENSWHYITVTPTRPDRKIEFAINVVITGMSNICLYRVGPNHTFGDLKRFKIAVLMVYWDCL